MTLVLVQIVGALIQAMVYLIIARAVGSFFVRDWSRGIPRLLWDLTEPVLGPIRRVLPAMGGLDFSPLVAIIGLQLLNSFIVKLAF